MVKEITTVIIRWKCGMCGKENWDYPTHHQIVKRYRKKGEEQHIWYKYDKDLRCPYCGGVVPPLKNKEVK